MKVVDSEERHIHKSSQYKGGNGMVQKRDSSHITAQRKGKKRDLYACQICGSTDHTEGHHMFDYSTGGAGNVDNIVTLCHDCHANVHKGFIDLFKF